MHLKTIRKHRPMIPTIRSSRFTNALHSALYKQNPLHYITLNTIRRLPYPGFPIHRTQQSTVSTGDVNPGKGSFYAI